MGVSIDKKCRDVCDVVCPITAEDVHKVILQAFDILTDCKACFEEKQKALYCLEKTYRCLIDINYPYTFKYYRDCLIGEFFFFIATVKGGFAVDFVAYKDIDQWVVLNTGSCVRAVNYGGCSKTQYSVSKRRDLVGEVKHKYEIRAAEIERIRKTNDYCYGKGFQVDWRCKPVCEILEPCHGSKHQKDFAILVEVKNWNLCADGKHAKVYIDGKCTHTLHSCDLIYVDTKCLKKGWHTLELRLYDECGKFIGIGCKKKFCYCPPKCKKPKKKSRCNDCHKDYDDANRCGCKPKKCKKPKKCESSSSSSSCSSSSSSSCSSSSSDSCPSSCSSESSIVYNFDKSYECSSSSSSSCSSSSSSSSCSSSSSSSCPSSSSSSCDSSSSDYVLKCKKYVVDKCDKDKKHKYYH
uniref:Uncharacterized protein n=1 Tax=viral metagenome TaxID=1070528 RepID=A0A6C0BKM1_9ZZZZ